MPVALIPSFLLYCYVSAITPGPANLCSLSAALRYGRGPALRQWRGLFSGFFIVSMVSVAVTYLLGAVLDRYVGVLSWVGAAYILWMAWHMLRPAKSGGRDPAAPSFRTGLLVQLTNVKIMVFCMTPWLPTCCPIPTPSGACWQWACSCPSPGLWPIWCGCLPERPCRSC